ncbi:hypothetical protein [Moraxella lacunata]|uniref:hypothetical protein n=1 Tax=Moraxella lacunata TaxID=477 RepID=UPI003EE2F72B
MALAHATSDTPMTDRARVDKDKKRPDERCLVCMMSSMIWAVKDGLAYQTNFATHLAVV